MYNQLVSELTKELADDLSISRILNGMWQVSGTHGFIDPEVEPCITVNDHPLLQACLSLPLSGEPRAAYCYVKENKREQFLNYVNTHFSKQLKCVESPTIIEENYFGLGKPHLHARYFPPPYIIG